ncbi:MAG: DNA-3-methyladenine glycosylase 2 family protein [Acidobacteriota bacterium]
MASRNVKPSTRRPESTQRTLRFSITPIAPFRLDLTAWALRRRPQNLVDRWDGITYRRVIPFDNAPVEMAVRQTGSSSAPRVIVRLTGERLRPEYRREARALVEKMFGLRVDLTPFYKMASQDSKLESLVEKFRGLKPPRFPTLFETLANAFACQQLSLTVGLGLLSRLAARCSLSLTQQDGTHYAFPRPQDLLKVTPEEFRKLGFSGNKVRAFHELAQGIVNGRINLTGLESMDNQAVLDYLLTLRGVGRWTAEYVLLRGLAPLNVFPGDDVGARNRLAKWQHRKEPLDYEGVARLTRRWQPYAGMVYFHMLLEGLSEAGALKNSSHG